MCILWLFKDSLFYLRIKKQSSLLQIQLYSNTPNKIDAYIHTTCQWKPNLSFTHFAIIRHFNLCSLKHLKKHAWSLTHCLLKARCLYRILPSSVKQKQIEYSKSITFTHVTKINFSSGWALKHLWRHSSLLWHGIIKSKN